MSADQAQHISAQDMVEQVQARFEGLNLVEAWGEQSLFYNPGNLFSRGTYFCTVKSKDGDNDRASALDRDGVWRLNFGLPNNRFVEIFGAKPARPGKGGVIEGPWDFTTLDQLMPHPVYGWGGWVCVNCPSARTVEKLWPLMALAHKKAAANFNTRARKLK